MAKRATIFTRSYSDKTGEIAISHESNEEPGFTANVSELKGGDALSLPSTVASAVMRYSMDVLVSVAGTALKADGGTLEKAWDKVSETWAALCDGSFKFRSASGSGEMSAEEEQKFIAETLVSLGKFADMESASAKVAEIYATTKEATRKAKDGTEKKIIQRPRYNKLRNSPDIKAALAKANKADDGLDDLIAD
jgi:hypothetical protein